MVMSNGIQVLVAMMSMDAEVPSSVNMVLNGYIEVSTVGNSVYMICHSRTGTVCQPVQRKCQWSLEDRTSLHIMKHNIHSYKCCTTLRSVMQYKVTMPNDCEAKMWGNVALIAGFEVPTSGGRLFYRFNTRSCTVTQPIQVLNDWPSLCIVTQITHHYSLLLYILHHYASLHIITHCYSTLHILLIVVHYYAN